MTVEEHAAPARTYTGLGRVLDLNGMLLDVGKAQLEAGDDGWRGTVRVFKGSCLESRSLTCLLDVDGNRSRAQVGPKLSDAEDDLIDVKVVGIGPVPF